MRMHTIWQIEGFLCKHYAEQPGHELACITSKHEWESFVEVHNINLFVMKKIIIIIILKSIISGNE